MADHASSLVFRAMGGPAAEAPSIADYALIGDCRTAALVSRERSIDWLCLPVFSDGSVFARILDPRGGCFSLRPAGMFSVARRYLDGTAVLETTFTTGAGVARVLDCLPVIDGVSGMQPLREVLRVLEGVSGTVAFEVTLEPRPDYAGVYSRGCGDGGSWGGSATGATRCSTLAARPICTGTGTRYAARWRLRRESGGRLACHTATARWRWCRRWATPQRSGWSARRTGGAPGRSGSGLRGNNRDAVIRSAVTLKLLTFAPSGAIVAALSTADELWFSRTLV